MVSDERRGLGADHAILNTAQQFLGLGERQADLLQLVMGLVQLRIPVKVISDSGLNVISDSGQSGHRSERSDAGVGL